MTKRGNTAETREMDRKKKENVKGWIVSCRFRFHIVSYMLRSSPFLSAIFRCYRLDLNED